METIIKQSVFNGLMQKLEIYPAETEAERYDNWMRNVVKSKWYANNEAMLRGYERVNN